jgi:hypothetical protein
MGCGREQATLHEMGRSSSLPTSTTDPDQLACITCGQQWQATPACAATGGTAQRLQQRSPDAIGTSLLRLMGYPRMSKRPRITTDTEADRYPQFPCTENKSASPLPGVTRARRPRPGSTDPAPPNGGPRRPPPSDPRPPPSLRAHGYLVPPLARSRARPPASVERAAPAGGPCGKPPALVGPVTESTACAPAAVTPGRLAARAWLGAPQPPAAGAPPAACASAHPGPGHPHGPGT